MSSVQTTVLDLVSHPNLSGGLSNVSTILGEMVEERRIDVAQLVASAAMYPTSIAQRCGWLLDFVAHHVGVELDTSPLADSL